MEKTFSWGQGTGAIKVIYGGQGNGNISVSSDHNDTRAARSKTLTVTDGTIRREVTVLQQASPLNFRSADGKYIVTADGKYFNAKE